MIPKKEMRGGGERELELKAKEVFLKTKGFWGVPEGEEKREGRRAEKVRSRRNSRVKD